MRASAPLLVVEDLKTYFFTRRGVTKAVDAGKIGEVPNPANPPPGCRFHPRCRRAMPQCQSQEPEWREVKPGRFTACHLY